MLAVGVGGSMFLRPKLCRATTLARALSSSAALTHAAAGPLWPQLNEKLGAEAMPSADEWNAHGEAITTALLGHSVPIESLDATTVARVYHLYLPIYFFARGASRRCVIRILFLLSQS